MERCASCRLMRDEDQLGTCTLCGARVCGLLDSNCTSEHICDTQHGAGIVSGLVFLQLLVLALLRRAR